MAFDFSKGTPVATPQPTTVPSAPAQPTGFAAKWGGGKVITPATTSPVAPPKPGFLSRVASDAATRVNSGGDAFLSAQQGKESNTEAFAHTIGQGAGLISDVATEGLKSVGDAITATDKTTGKVTSLSDRISGLLQDAGHTAAGQEIGTLLADFEKNHPVASDYLGSAFNVAGIIPVGKGAEVAAEGVEDAAKAGAAKAVDATKTIVGAPVNAREALSKGSRVAGLEKSASRIQEKAATAAPSVADAVTRPGMSVSNVKDPLSTYDEFSAQQDKAAVDTKEDTAMGMVGSRIGNAYAKVARMRKVAGQTMSDELKKVGSTVAKIGDANSNLYKTLLRDENLSYNFNTGKLTPAAGVKQVAMTTSDQKLIENYLGDLKGLGPNPTIADLDAFIKRVPNELDVAKAASGLVGKVSNGERIIKNHLTSLRDELDAKIDPKTGVAQKPELVKYSNARKTYSKLSDFLKEGESYLGKKTQSGDFAKDASLAKSSVQSLLNNGKKDWLLALEGHTGYPALDEAVLGLQAMKDSGDFRGGSLLELLSESAQQGKIPEIPTGATAIVNALAGKALKKAGQAFVGTPREQTRRFLQSLKKAI